MIRFLVLCSCLLVTACAASSINGKNPQQIVTKSQETELDSDLDDLLPQLLDAYAVPGAAIGIIRNGSVWRAKGYGVQDVRTGAPITVDTVFNVGSISKPVTAWGVMRLIDKRQLSLDTSVNSRLTRWSVPSSQFDAHGVTVERLLRHTAGLSMWGVPEFAPGTTVPSLEEMLNATTDGVRDIRITHAPGTQWEYSGGGYAVLQLLVEEISRRDFSAYMSTEVLEPLAMNASSYEWNGVVVAAAATPHDSAGQPTPGQRFTATSAAGLQTTLNDLLKFAVASIGLNDRRPRPLLSDRTANKMLTTSEIARNYGLGYEVWNVGGIRLVGHGGNNEGWMAQLTLSPDSNDGIAILTNAVNGLRVVSEVQCLWLLRTFERGCEGLSPMPMQVDAEKLRKFEGTYRDPSGATVGLNVRHGHLFWKTDYGYDFALRAIGDSQFGWVIGDSRLTFKFSKDGTVLGLTRHRGSEQTHFAKAGP